MFRIDSSGAVTSIPTPAAPGSTSGYFTGGNPALGQVATRLTADWFNAVQEELMAVLTAASVTPSKTNQAQLLAALQALFNVKLGFTPVQQGTGVGQLSNLVKLGWSAGSKLKATVDVTDLGNLALESWVSALPGRLLNIQVFTASGTYTPTSGTTKIRVRMVGGGGPGGSVAAAGTGEAASGGGGGSGAYAEGIFTSGFSGAAVTVGAGAAAPPAGNNSGSAGGTTSLGVLISAPGGSVGLGSPAFATSFATGAGEQSSAPGGGNIFMSPGNPGQCGFVFAAGNCFGGNGGDSPFGAGGGPAVFNGNAGAGYGSGGSGAAAYQNTGPYAGAAGRPGIVIIEEYTA